MERVRLDFTNDVTMGDNSTLLSPLSLQQLAPSITIGAAGVLLSILALVVEILGCHRAREMFVPGEF